MKIYSANTDAPTGQIVDMGCQKFLGRYVSLESAKAACQALEDKASNNAGQQATPLEWISARDRYDPFMRASSDYEYSFEIHEMDVNE